MDYSIIGRKEKKHQKNISLIDIQISFYVYSLICYRSLTAGELFKLEFFVDILLKIVPDESLQNYT